MPNFCIYCMVETVVNPDSGMCPSCEQYIVVECNRLELAAVLERARIGKLGELIGDFSNPPF